MALCCKKVVSACYVLDPLASQGLIAWELLKYQSTGEIYSQSELQEEEQENDSHLCARVV